MGSYLEQVCGLPRPDSGPSSLWVCVGCTSKNQGSAKSCAVCKTARPKERPEFVVPVDPVNLQEVDVAAHFALQSNA